VLPSATTLSYICRSEYALIVDAIKRQLQVRNTVSWALDGWTLGNKLAIKSVIACNIDRNWALPEVQIAFDEVVCLFYSYIKDDRSRADILEQDKRYIWRMCLIVLSLPMAVCLVLHLILLPQTTGWHASCNQHLRPLEYSDRHWGTTYHAWRTSYSWL